MPTPENHLRCPWNPTQKQLDHGVKQAFPGYFQNPEDKKDKDLDSNKPDWYVFV